MRISPIFKRNIFPLALFILTVIICWVNYSPGTYLSGWDTLHPEFDFGLYFKRIFFGVWQEHQGLGAVASQAHASELPRMFIYYLSSLILPDSFLRYGYFFLTLIAGTLGTYFFLERVILKNLPRIAGQTAAFSGALLYLLNLATLQHYYVPLEMFATHFATLPWLFLFTSKYLENGTSRNLIFFSLITILSTSMAHTATLFYAYFLGLLLYISTLAFFSFKETIRRALLILLTTLVLNSFWLLPNIYFVASHGKDVVDSKIHTQFSEKAFLTGRQFGTIKDTAILKNFLFDWGEYDDKKQESISLFDEWTPHLNSPIANFIAYGIFTLVLRGIAIVFRRQEKYGLAILPVFIVSFLFIANDLPLFREIFAFLQNEVPFFREALRFPFTKFSILLLFAYTVYFAVALNWLTGLLIKRVKKERILYLLQALTILIALVYYMWPAFKGNLISHSMKVQIPKEYFAMFNWLNKQETTGRIAEFPVHTFWGWAYYDWQYEGAGFLWFGLKQPLLDREFDRWSPYNENYYWEASYAVYSKNPALLENVLEKYQIRWLLVDENIINPPSSKALYLDELEETLKNSNKVTLTQQFGSPAQAGKIKVYRVNLEAPVNNFVFLAENLATTGPIYKWNNYDRAFNDNGYYLASSIQSPASSFYYPFRSLFTGRSQQDLEFTVEDRGDYFAFSKTLPAGSDNYVLEVPPPSSQILTWVDPNDLSQTKTVPLDVFFDGKNIEVKVPKAGGYFSAEIEPTTVNCDNVVRGFLRLTLINNSNCTAFNLPNLTHDMAYLITAETKNISGRPILFWLENPNSRRADIETYLPASSSKHLASSYFIQPPMEKDGVGYVLHFDNVSIGKEKSTNELGKITVNPIPYKFLTGLVLKKSSTNQFPVRLTELEVNHPNPSLYSITIEQFNNLTINNPVLVLSQSYDTGWKAYQCQMSNVKCQILPMVFGREIKNHVLVNNWANGWVLNNSSFQPPASSLVILYLPQYLEYLGFLLLIISAIMYLIKYGRRYT